MGNKQAIALLEGTGMTEEQRMNALMKLIEDKLNAETIEERSQIDGTPDTHYLEILCDRARGMFTEMDTGLEKRYIAEVKWTMPMRVGDFWSLHVQYRRAAWKIREKYGAGIINGAGQARGWGAAQITASQIQSGTIRADHIQTGREAFRLTQELTEEQLREAWQQTEIAMRNGSVIRPMGRSRS